MLAGMRLIRRIGMAVGAAILVFDMPNPYNRTGMVVGAAILAFFLPAVEATSFSKDK
jgi:hypothetical protein